MAGMFQRRALPALALTLALALTTSTVRAAAPWSAAPGVAAPPAQATAVPQPESIRRDVDTALNAHLAKLLAFEADYVRSHGRFFQALPSHTAPPADGARVSPDQLSAGPSDQAEKADYLWQQLKLDAALPYSSRVDVYDGPRGAGYVLIVSATLGGQLWERSVNTGPETYREQPWHAVVGRVP